MNNKTLQSCVITICLLFACTCVSKSQLNTLFNSSDSVSRIIKARFDEYRAINEVSCASPLHIDRLIYIDSALFAFKKDSALQPNTWLNMMEHCALYQLEFSKPISNEDFISKFYVDTNITHTHDFMILCNNDSITRFYCIKENKFRRLIAIENHIEPEIFKNKESSANESSGYKTVGLVIIGKNGIEYFISDYFLIMENELFSIKTLTMLAGGSEKIEELINKKSEVLQQANLYNIIKEQSK